MQKLMFSLLLLAGLSFTAIAGQPTDGSFTVNPASSTVKWVGKKVTGQHDGSIAIKDGNLQFRKSALVGGNVTIDMTSIKVLDLKGEGATKLEGHLKHDDFFGVDKHPTAILKITDAKPNGKGTYDIKADLTIKGITKPVSFPATVVSHGKGYKATAIITIDRSLYDIKYGSGKFFDNLGDKTIEDDFQLNVSVVAE